MEKLSRSLDLVTDIFNQPVFKFSDQQKFRRQRARISSVWTRGLALILLLLGARGTFGLFPLGEHDTVISSVPFLNTLSYGTGHAISRAVQLKIQQQKMGTSKWNANLKEFGYLDREDQAFKDFFQKELKNEKKEF